ncbi:MAG: PDR/VanB family oxidoreductase [Ottowia sp.]|uniref:PDR/VanB family oxidoreductase n=2 Tax=unclassified Ottowia TaxID=2645081 RepID=UPI003C767F25
MIQAVVSRIQAIARDVLLLELQAAGGQALPGASPGAHVDVHLPNGQIRQYSLTNAEGQGTQARYQIAVARDAHSRGGSAWIHDKLRVGTPLAISEPRNLFALDAEAHGKVLFIGAGIGITPIYAMVQSARKSGLDWTLAACARSSSRLAFLEELSALDPARVQFHFDLAQSGPLPLATLLAGSPWDAVYACGPAGMLDAIEALTTSWSEGSVRMERFKAEQKDASANTAFELVLARSGQSIEVSAAESPLDALERMGVEHPFSCREGLCGTCEVSVIDGVPDHRDNVLDSREKASGLRFIPCVSRCSGRKLVIDL